MRLIDADALKKYIDDCAFCKSCPNKNKWNSYCTLDCKFPDYCDDEWQRAIDEQPTIEERKKRRWIKDDGHPGKWFCECGCLRLGKHPYCECCGAEMVNWRE